MSNVQPDYESNPKVQEILAVGRTILEANGDPTIVNLCQDRIQEKVDAFLGIFPTEGARSLVSRDVFQLLYEQSLGSIHCPICKTPLVQTGRRRLESLGEHCSDPNGTPSLKSAYGCPNADCPACQDALMWDPDGGYYGAKREGADWHKKYPFIDNNHAPFGSMERKINVECKGQECGPEVDVHGNPKMKDVNLRVGSWSLRGEVKFKADDDGRILEQSRRYSLLHNGQLSGIHMFSYVLRHFWLNRRCWIRNQRDGKPTEWFLGEMKRSLERKPHETRWWAVSSAWLLRNLFRNTYRACQETENAKA